MRMIEIMRIWTWWSFILHMVYSINQNDISIYEFGIFCSFLPKFCFKFYCIIFEVTSSELRFIRLHLLWYSVKKIPEIFFTKNSRLHLINWLYVITIEVKFAFDLHAIAYRTPTKSKLKFVNKFNDKNWNFKHCFHVIWYELEVKRLIGVAQLLVHYVVYFIILEYIRSVFI